MTNVGEPLLCAAAQVKLHCNLQGRPLESQGVAAPRRAIEAIEATPQSPLARALRAVQNAMEDGDAFELDDLDALLDAEPVEAEEYDEVAPVSAPTKVVTDYSKWDRLGKTIDEEEDEEEPEVYNDEQQKTWDRMVKASGLQEEMKEELGLDDNESVEAREPNEWRVVYSPCVAVREKPSVASRMVGIKRVNNLVGVDYTIESQWLKLKGERGFMLIHGQDLGLGQLLVPNRGHYADGAPKVPSSSE